MKCIVSRIALAAAALIWICSIPNAHAQQIYVVEADGAISPGMAEHLIGAIQAAEKNAASCLIIEMDTPGGLAESMRRIIKAILGSTVPIIVYVAPSGARAASAGVMITMAADIAAMAPGTNIGAAHPVGAGGKEIDETMSEKIVNDMVAHARSVAEKRGRNADWVEKAIRESVSVTEVEALERNIIDIVAADRQALIAQLNGRRIDGEGVLDLDDATVTVLAESLRTKVLKAISDPNISYILMMIGLAGLYFEFSNPGTIFPGVIGGIALILAFFAFQTLPVNSAGLLLIALAIVFFVLEMKITSYGMLSLAGVVSLLLGSLMLFSADSPELRLAWKVLIPTVVLVSGFFIAVAGLVFRAQISRPATGSAGLVGKIGVVKRELNPEGKVFVHGELWNAVCTGTIPLATKVRVTAVRGLVLEVEPAEGKAEIDPDASV